MLFISVQALFLLTETTSGLHIWWVFLQYHVVNDVKRICKTNRNILCNSKKIKIVHLGAFCELNASNGLLNFEFNLLCTELAGFTEELVKLQVLPLKTSHNLPLLSTSICCSIITHGIRTSYFIFSRSTNSIYYLFQLINEKSDGARGEWKNIKILTR